jgi:peptide/nickel transport system substrate-binding protein
VVFNFESDYSDVRLRRAVALCVPRKQIVDELVKPVHGKAEPLRTRIVPASDPRYEEVAAAAGGQAYARTDVAESRRLLADAGATGKVLRVGWYKLQNPNERNLRIVELLKQSCGAAGFDVQDVGADSYEPITERKFDIALVGWDGRPTPAAWSVLLHTPRDDLAAFNYGNYHSAAVDGWLDDLAKELDPDRQLRLLKQVEQKLSEDLPTVPLYATPGIVFLGQKVTGVVPNGTLQGLTWDADRWDLR